MALQDRDAAVRGELKSTAGEADPRVSRIRPIRARKARREDGIDGREFAEKKMEELQAMGFARKQAVRIMRPAGPVWCIEAVRLAERLFASASDEANPPGDVLPDLDGLACLLGGAALKDDRDVRLEYSPARTRQMLELQGIDVPEAAKEEHAIARVLLGAREALLIMTERHIEKLPFA